MIMIKAEASQGLKIQQYTLDLNVPLDLGAANPSKQDITLDVEEGKICFVWVSSVVTSSPSGMPNEQVTQDVLLDGDESHPIGLTSWDATPNNGSSGFCMCNTGVLKAGEHVLTLRWMDSDGNGAILNGRATVTLLFM